MNEYELQEIWKKNLREFNDVMRLDSIIIRAMQEAINEVQSKQCNIADVSISLERAKKYARHQHFLGTQGSELVEFEDWSQD